MKIFKKNEKPETIEYYKYKILKIILAEKMKIIKETIWHFTCDFCGIWWSFASSDEYQPKKNVFCPHCGEENEIET
tara:strand:- start:1130 stop:1357 length:228 start_codon:yes stop_codon:yes gene_type:complete